MPTKRARKHNARPLPEGLTQEMLPKYVVYYHECYNKERQLFREFFKIEKHPKLIKPIIGSKSNKFTWQQKLATIKERLQKLNDEGKENITLYSKTPPDIHSENST